jgi:hypothetical protein
VIDIYRRPLLSLLIPMDWIRTCYGQTIQLELPAVLYAPLRVHDAGGYVAYINLTSYAGDQR